MKVLSTRARAAGLLALALTAACSDRDASPTAPEAARPELTAEAAVTLERANLDEVTRAVALALRDAGLRQRIKSDLRASHHTAEHKLPFGAYLRGASGGILLAKMAAETGRTREYLLAQLDSVRDLEFYMPVTEHRESWTGGDDLLVASLLDEHTVPTVFTLDGTPVALSAETPPATPTLVLVPDETEFERPLDPRSFVNTNDRGGAAIGTLAPRRNAGARLSSSCDEEYAIQECDDGTGGGVVITRKPAGLYMTFNHLLDDGEAWTKGAPEIEVMLFGYTPEDTYGNANKLSCAGESADGARNFNQDSRTFYGDVLLYTKEEIDAYAARFPQDPFAIIFWEDDQERCVVKTDVNAWSEFMKTLAEMYGWNSLRVGTVNPFGCTMSCYVALGATLAAIVYRSADWLQTNDDQLGVAILTDIYSDANYRLERKGHGNNGRANIVLKDVH